jgi:predicted transposase YdaD
LRTVAASDLSEGDKLFLIELINTYLPTAVLADAQEEIMDQLLEIEQSWGDKLREEGLEQGLKQGLEQGQLAGKRTLLLRMLTLMFGDLPPEITNFVNNITDDAMFDQLAQRMLAAQRLEDVVPPGDFTGP